MSEAREHKPQRTKHKVQSTALYDLERKERFELSKRVWKTRMFPATSLPQEIGTPGRIRTRNLDVRSVALFQLRYRSRRNLEHRTGFEPVSQRWQRRVLNPLDQRCGKKKSAWYFVFCS